MPQPAPPSSLPTHLYDRKGPWPQPSSIDIKGMAPEVVHLPKPIIKEFKRNTGRHYNNVLFFYWPVAIWKTLTSKYLKPVTEEEFNLWMGDSAFSKFLVNITHPHGVEENDPYRRDKMDIAWVREKFKAQLDDQHTKNVYFVSDFKLMEVVTPYPGMYVAPVVLLMEQRPESRGKIAKAIYFYNGDFVVTPENDKSWELSKYYVLMGANYRLTLSVHALLHFPMDTVNAVTQTSLSTTHPLFRLLYPHLQYSLGVDNAVLDSPESPIRNVPWLPYTLLTGPGSGIAELFFRGYLGDPEDHASYAKFLFKLSPPAVDSYYGEFLMDYYKVVLQFTTSACALIHEELARDASLKAEVAYWAQSIHAWYPEFPGADAIFEKDNLAKATAMFIWDVSIAHTADHYNFSFQTTPQKAPFRIRQQPPSSPDSVGHVARRKLNSFVDQFKYHYVRKMFFEPFIVSKLIDCTYAFDNKYLNVQLQEAVADFKKGLHQTDAKWEPFRKRGYKFLPLDKIASSIQF